MPARAATSSGNNNSNRKHIDVWDVGRMLKFIEQESEQKAHEIRIKANEEYSIEIAELAIQSSERVKQQKSDEMAKIKAEKTIAEGKLRSNAILTLSSAKEKVCSQIMKEVCGLLSNRSLSKKLATAAISKFKTILPDEHMVIYVPEKDKALLSSLLSPSEFTFEPMHPNLLGGIVIRNTSRTVLINSSFLERAAKIEKRVMPGLQAALFR
ncbi:V-type H+-transporting ATPase subunit E [Nematocida homosporus]|uniref:V-type H+-transporting ATPase subunit E n=1 Tax=Nematocida homosporus TaxID=1912981 RepID=UPI0022208686|nr:V-type H+-transporting ATPase subunit E [Nematocida homosporus]KAI5184962.1 V-type H+-transporting ATPase subunit E [Nematocida homosporus]